MVSITKKAYLCLITILLCFNSNFLNSSSPGLKLSTEKTTFQGNLPKQDTQPSRQPAQFNMGQILRQTNLAEAQSQEFRREVERQLRGEKIWGIPSQTSGRIEDKSYFQTKYASKIGNNYDSNESIFIDFNSYVHPGFREFVKEVPGYVSFVYKLNNLFKNKNNRDQYKKHGTGGGLKDWEFIDHIEAEAKRLDQTLYFQPTIESKEHFQEKYALSASNNYDQNLYIFESYDDYFHPGFLEFLQDLPGYEDFIIAHSEDFELDWIRDQHYKPDRSEAGLKHFDTVERYIKSEAARIIDSRKAYNSQMQDICQKFKDRQTFREDSKEIELQKGDFENCKASLTQQLSQKKEELLTTKEDDKYDELQLRFLNQAKDAFNNNNSKDFIRIRRRIEVLSLVRENFNEKNTQAHPLTEKAFFELSALNIEPEKFKTFYGDSAQQLLIRETVEVVNETSDLKGFYGHERQIISLTNLIYKTSDITYKHCAASELEVGFALSDFGNRLLETLEKSTNLLTKAIENTPIVGTKGVIKDSLIYLVYLVYEENCNYDTRYYGPTPNQVIYKNLTLDFLQACKNSAAALSKAIVLKAQNLEKFKNILPLDESQHPYSRWTEPYIENASNNIDLVSKALFDQDVASANEMVEAYKSSLRSIEGLVGHISRLALPNVLCPVKDIFCKAGEILKLEAEKTKNMDAKEEEEIPPALEEPNFIQEQETKRNKWVSQEEKRLESEERNRKSFEAIKESENHDYWGDKESLEDYFVSFPELQKMNDEFKRVKNSGEHNEYKTKLSSLGSQFIKEAKNQFNSDSFEELSQHQTTKDRIQSIYETISSPDGLTPQTSTYKLQENTASLLKRSGLNPESFATFSGDHAQQCLHKELVATVNKTSNLLDSHIDNFQITAISTLIYNAAEEAVLCNKDKELERGFTLSNVCSEFYEFEKKSAILFVKEYMALGKGAALGIFNSGKFVYNTFRHPIDTTVELAMPIIWLAKAALLSYKDPEEFTRKFNELPEKSKLIASKVNNYVCENPLESLTNAVAFITEFILINKIPTSQSLAIRPLCKIARILKEEEMLAQKILDPKLRKAATPVTQAIKQTKKVVKTAATRSVKNTKSAIKTLKNPKYWLNEKGDLVEAVEVLASFKENFPRQNLKHLFCGEIKNGKLKGFHHARSYPERIKRIIHPPNEHGVYGAIYCYQGKSHYSTFFPNEWDRIKVMQKVNESFRNPIKKMQHGIRGRTIEGMEIDTWFIKIKSTGEIIINSSYPLIPKN